MKIRPVRTALFHAELQTDRKTGIETDRHDEVDRFFF